MNSGPSGLRALLASVGAVAAPGVHDPLTARIAARAGHPCLYLGGNAMALGLGKGQPFLTATETASITARVAAVVDLPLLVDAGAGFGLPSHLDLAVREIEKAGAAGLHIDDQPYPKRASYHRGRGSVVDSGTMASRIRAAAAARHDRELVLVARTDALRVTGSVDQALERCRRYVDAGADALMVLDLAPEQAEPFRHTFPETPLIWIGGVSPPVPSVDDLTAAGFALACYPFNGIAEISVALADLWTRLAEGGRIAQDPQLLARARAHALALADMQRAWDLEDEHDNA
jgi:2-methylisocitrate lyase-like PEP mutase family enzyme